jgi:hypothetical protein
LNFDVVLMLKLVEDLRRTPAGREADRAEAEAEAIDEEAEEHTEGDGEGRLRYA